MDVKNRQKEKPSPKAQACETLINTPEKDQRNVRDGEHDEAKSSKKKKHSGQLLGKKKTGISRTEDRTEGEVLPERKQKRKKRAKDGKMDTGDDEKRAKTESGDEDKHGGSKDTEQETHSLIRQVKSEKDEVHKSSTEVKTGCEDRSEESDEDECSGADQYISWVQCSRASCGKWRRLSDSVDPSVLPNNWTCELNTDPAFSSCSAPEEKCSVSEEEVFYNLVPGSLVWARQIGYPWWPAMVEKDPDTHRYLEFRKHSDLTPYKCHVTFFGDPVMRAWVLCSRVRDYADPSEEQISDQELLKEAIQMSEEAVSLSLKDRLMKFGFYSRYLSDRESSEVDSDIAEVLELFSGESGSDYEDVKRKKQSLTEGKEKRRPRERRRRKTGGKETHREKREPKKKAEGRKEGAKEAKDVNAVRVKREKHLIPSFSQPKKKRDEHRKDTGDQTVPQSAVGATPDASGMPAPPRPTEGAKKDGERKKKTARRNREENYKSKSHGDEVKDAELFGSRDKKQLVCKDQDEEDQDRFSLVLLEEE